jgi:hypothetical protein
VEGRKMKKLAVVFFTVLFLSFLSVVTSPVNADTITDLFNTGLDGSGSLLGDNVDDPHYSITSQPTAGLSDRTVTDGVFPLGGTWVANGADYRWIGPNTDEARGPNGVYVYSTTFTVPMDAVLSSVSIEGDWATDNSGSISLNSNATGNSIASPGFASLTAFTISSGFSLGMNTLDFIVTNSGTNSPNPTGIIVKMTGEYTPVPIPATIWLLGAPLLYLFRFRKRARN